MDVASGRARAGGLDGRARLTRRLDRPDHGAEKPLDDIAQNPLGALNHPTSSKPAEKITCYSIILDNQVEF